MVGIEKMRWKHSNSKIIFIIEIILGLNNPMMGIILQLGWRSWGTVSLKIFVCQCMAKIHWCFILHCPKPTLIYSAVANSPSVLPRPRRRVRLLNSICPIAKMRLPSSSLNNAIFILNASFASSTMRSTVP